MSPNHDEIAALVRPYLRGEPTEKLVSQLATYLDLLLRWNARTNLTAVRSPQEIVRTHFGESLFAAQHLPPGLTTLLDFGSGAGFPGLPIQLFQPDLRVTLAESQGKKAAFLSEVVRRLELATTVHSGRIEDMQPDRLFSAVCLRAVDDMATAIAAASLRVAPGGWLILLSTKKQCSDLELPEGFANKSMISVPHSEQKVLLLNARI